MDKNVLEDVVRLFKKNGADDVDILLDMNKTMSVSSRLGKIEDEVVSGETSVRLRAIVGNRSAALVADHVRYLLDQEVVDTLVSAARLAPEPEGPFRPEVEDLYHAYEEAEGCFSLSSFSEADLEEIKSDVTACEDAGLSVEGVTNSEGANIRRCKSITTVVRGNDFCKSYASSFNSLSFVAIAEKNGELKQGFYCSQAVRYKQLRSGKEVAELAAQRAVKKIGSRKIKSCKVPVVFAKEAAQQIIAGFLDALKGDLLANKMSFLSGRLFSQTFGDLCIYNVASLLDGLGTRPFDSEGVKCKFNPLIDVGVITSQLLNSKYAYKLGKESTGNAIGFDDIGYNNVFVRTEGCTPTSLIPRITNGLYITELMGNGVNVVTGDYSQGASGFWVENGEIAYPVHEITLSGKITDMLGRCEFTEDLKLENDIISGEMFVDSMVVGGL